MSNEGTKTQPMFLKTEIPQENLELRFTNKLD